ncbi:SDR family NAD(P)-dependent oxidoreductase [Streptomyces roseolus]|uniref:SDR family NAD(P)-dependent oxidoreductase n=1 Tax=Streptomyces roseolus TaxID=67358 RepID=UPI003795CC3A
MNAVEKKVLLVGATGGIGGIATRQLAGHGAATALAGRDPERLRARGAALGGLPWRTFDAYDLDGCARLAPWAGEVLGGLDAVVVAVGVAAFGAAADVSDASAEHLFTVNALCPMAVVRGALPVLPRGGVAVVVTGEIVDRPPLGTADYAAAKAALAMWLRVTGREARRDGITLVDARPPHLDTGFASRAVAGSPPALGPGADPEEAVRHHVVLPLLKALES